MYSFLKITLQELLQRQAGLSLRLLNPFFLLSGYFSLAKRDTKSLIKNRDLLLIVLKAKKSKNKLLAHGKDLIVPLESGRGHHLARIHLHEMEK